MRIFVSGAEEAVAAELAAILPPVTAAMHDTKNEVRRTPIGRLLNIIIGRLLLQLSSLRLHYAPLLLTQIWIPILVKCMYDTTSVPLCIKSCPVQLS